MALVIRAETTAKSARAVLTFYEQAEDFELTTAPALGHWLHQLLGTLATDYTQKLTLRDVAATFPPAAGPWEVFLAGPAWALLREKGLVLV